MATSIYSRIIGTLHGIAIGDALAMPVHWYYNRQALYEDYGEVVDYLSPRNPHPDSILWRSSYIAPNPQGDILHDQAPYWGQKGIHYHQFLKAGENTLNVKICSLLIESMSQVGTYDSNDFLNRYIPYMITPGNHQDTYVEECHRNFFRNYANGVPPHKCGMKEKHIGGIVGLIPVVAFYFNQPEMARLAALKHLSLTHPGSKMADAGTLIIDLLLKLFDGMPLKEAILEQGETQNNPFIRHPLKKWLNDPDDGVIGPRLSTACYVEDSIPAVLYLALKYHGDPEQALIVNTNLGGDNAARGSVLGALMGAANGDEKFPRRWVDGLLAPLPELTWSQTKIR